MGVLRLILALTIVLGHMPSIGSYFWLAVIVVVKAFFVISGFYMALILGSKYHSIGAFYLNRFLRLYPTYALVLILSVAVALVTPDHRVGPFIDLQRWEPFWHLPGLAWAKAWLVFSNLSMVGIETTLYGCVDLANRGAVALYQHGCPGITFNNLVMIPQGWSISVEIAFYALAPLVVRVSNRTLGVLIVIGAFAPLGLVITGLYVNPWYRSTVPFELVYFLLGVALYRCYCWRNWRFLDSGPVDRWLGELSYPIYISHIFVMGLLTELGVSGIGLNIAAVLAFAALCILVVTRPVDRVRAQIAAKEQMTTRASNRLVDPAVPLRIAE